MKFPLSIFTQHMHTIAYAYQRSNDLANCSQLKHHTLFVHTMFSDSPNAYKIAQENYLLQFASTQIPHAEKYWRGKILANCCWRRKWWGIFWWVWSDDRPSVSFTVSMSIGQEKFWQIVHHSPNSQKFSPSNIFPCTLINTNYTCFAGILIVS